jgi:chromosome segregation ATPase
LIVIWYLLSSLLLCSPGGERSYATVAFLLALGTWTASPFRAMDEYDMFLDRVHRRIATQTLLEFALEESHLQFVLLTQQVSILQ